MKDYYKILELQFGASQERIREQYRFLLHAWHPDGRKICVYGRSYAIYYTDEASTRINFSSEPNTFFLYDPNYVYPDLREGDCVVAEEYIQLYDNKIPYMAISELYFCESWMK